jgi:hypothetical protein
MTRCSLSLVSLASALVLATPACKQSSKDGASGSSAAKPTEAARATSTRLPKVGLQIDIPGTAQLMDGVGESATLVTASAIGALQVDVPKQPQSLDEAKQDATLFNGKHLKAETLPDGWVLTYDNTGSMGANYFVQVRRDLAGKTYRCSTTVSDAKQAAAVVAACKTLRP